MSAKSLAGFGLAVLAGVLSNFTWEWVRTFAPLPSVRTTLTPNEGDSTVPTHPIQTQYRFIDGETLKSCLYGSAFVVGPGLLLALVLVQFCVHCYVILRNLWNRLDELHPIIRLLVFLTVSPYLILWADLKAALFAFGLWPYVVAWPFRAMVASCRSEYVPSFPEFWSANPF